MAAPGRIAGAARDGVLACAGERERREGKQKVERRKQERGEDAHPVGRCEVPGCRGAEGSRGARACWGCRLRGQRAAEGWRVRSPGVQDADMPSRGVRDAEVRDVGVPGWSHPCAALPAPRPRSSALPDVWRWQPGRFRIPDPSPQPRGRYITGADATHPAACHSLREARTGAASGGGPRRPGGGRHRHRHPAGPGGRGSGGGGGAEPAARARPLRPGPAGTPASRSPCTVGVGAGRGRAGRAGTAAGGGRRRGGGGQRGLGWWVPGRASRLGGSGQGAAVRAVGRTAEMRGDPARRRPQPHGRLGAGLLPPQPATRGGWGCLWGCLAPGCCSAGARRGRPPPALGLRFTCRLGAQVRGAGSPRLPDRAGGLVVASRVSSPGGPGEERGPGGAPTARSQVRFSSQAWS